MRTFAISSLVASFLPAVFAHGGVLSYSNAGSWYWGWKPYNSPDGQTTIQRPWATYDPIQDAEDPTLACNDDGTSGALQLTATVAAGSSITAYWNPWPHNTGPVLTYLAQCPGSTCTGVNANTLEWFKIEEAGLLSGTIFNGTWAAGKMIADNSTWTTVIPATVPSGNYLIRFETIALHSMPAQFYPECAQIQITGGGSLAPTAAELVTFPGAYSNTDPGLDIDIYSNEAQVTTTYVIPGPPLYGSTGGSSTVTSSRPSSTSSSAAPTSTGTVAQYGQCGGIGFTGPTACQSPYTCTVVNDYYSQCL